MESDLRKVSAVGARSVIVLADRTVSNPDMTDVNTVRTVLSLRKMGAPRNGHIVCEVCDVDNENLVTLVGRESVETIVCHDIIGRLMIQCARERGLAQVLDKLLGFEDNEFYINNCSQWPQLVGKKFGELMFCFESAVVVGIMRQGVAGGKAEVELNPADDVILRKGDSLIVIAEDDDSYAPSAAPSDTFDRQLTHLIAPAPSRERRHEKMLFVGWRRDMDDMINQLDTYVSSGSELTLFSNLTRKEREVRYCIGVCLC